MVKSSFLVLLSGLTLVACQRLNPAYEADVADTEASATTNTSVATAGGTAAGTSGPTPVTTTNATTEGTTVGAEGTSNATSDDGVTEDDSVGVEESGIGESSDSMGCAPPGGGPPFVEDCSHPQCLAADGMSCINQTESGPVAFPQQICVQAGCVDDCDCQIPGDDTLVMFCNEGEGCSIDCSAGNPCPAGMVCNSEFEVCLSNHAYGHCDETCGEGFCYTDFQGLEFEVCMHVNCNGPMGPDDSLCPPPPSGSAQPHCFVEDESMAGLVLGCVLECAFDEECPGDMACHDNGVCVHQF